MRHYNARRRSSQIESLRTQFAQADGLPFADVLPAERLVQALAEEDASWREVLYSPVLTLWAFLTQVMSADGSCRAAVVRVLAWLVSQGRPACSPKTDPYCKARQRLPESLLGRLTRETAGALYEEMPGEWLWNKRRVKVVDGTTVTMPDTPENQAEYPQLTSQTPGLGFPIMRLAVVFCLACGTVLDVAMGRCLGKKTGETALLRGWENAFEPGDVLLGDRGFAGWFDIAFWAKRSVDIVSRLHHRRRCDLRRGQRLGPNDHLVVYPKPQRPPWMDEETYAALPAELKLREVRVQVREHGLRTGSLVVVTTLVDPLEVSGEDLADLYRARWHAELDLRSLKITLGMDVLRCISPEMVRKEIWAHLLAYNLIRTVMAQAAKENGLRPREISFKGAQQTLAAFADRLVHSKHELHTYELYHELLTAIAAHRVGNRPGRAEPRARKHRRKQYPRLMKPRREARSQLLHTT